MTKIFIKTKNILQKFVNYFKIRKIHYLGNNYRLSKGLTIKGSQYISIGNNFYAGPNCRIEAWDSYNNIHFSPKLEIGNNVKINSKCHIGVINYICIKDDVLLGSNVFITDHSHGTTTLEDLEKSPDSRDLYSKNPVIIEEKCWICENVIILPGVHIGHNSVIGAGAVVTKNIPPYSIVVGNPARVIKKQKE